MRILLAISMLALGLTAGLQTTAAALSPPSTAVIGAPSQSVPIATHKCAKGQYWVSSGYAKHGKYRAGHCAPK
jgi:hypothetical protein